MYNTFKFEEDEFKSLKKNLYELKMMETFLSAPVFMDKKSDQSNCKNFTILHLAKSIPLQEKKEKARPKKGGFQRHNLIFVLLSICMLINA